MTQQTGKFDHQTYPDYPRCASSALSLTRLRVDLDTGCTMAGCQDGLRPVHPPGVAAGRRVVDVDVVGGGLPKSLPIAPSSSRPSIRSTSTIMPLLSKARTASMRLRSCSGTSSICRRSLAFAHKDGEAHAVGRVDGQMLVVHQQQVVARLGVGEADAAGIAWPAVVGDAAHGALLCTPRPTARTDERKFRQEDP